MTVYDLRDGNVISGWKYDFINGNMILSMEIWFDGWKYDLMDRKYDSIDGNITLIWGFS